MNLERKNADLMEKNLKILAEDQKKRKADADRCIADASKEAAGYLVNRSRGKVWVGIGKFKARR